MGFLTCTRCGKRYFTLHGHCCDHSDCLASRMSAISFNYRLFTKEQGNIQEFSLLPSEIYHQRTSANSNFVISNEELARTTILSDSPATTHACKAKRNIEHEPKVQFNRSELMSSGLRNVNQELPFALHNKIYSVPNLTESLRLIPRQMVSTPIHNDIQVSLRNKSDYYKVIERPSDVLMAEGLNKYNCSPNQKQLKINSRVVSERPKEIKADKITSFTSRQLHDNPSNDSRTVAGPSRSRQEECICPIRGKELSNKPKLERPSVMNSRKKSVNCDVCQKCYTQKGNLKIHMLSDTGLRPHKCGECGKAFTKKYHLEAHKRTHTGEKAFICYVCHKRFSQKSVLKRHTRIHTGEKPFPCDICGKAFAQKHNQKRHILIHKRGNTA